MIKIINEYKNYRGREYLTIENFLFEDIDSVKKNYPKVEDEMFYKLIALDPTYKEEKNSVGTYGKWILNLYNKGNLKEEDFYKVTEYLEEFEVAKKTFSNKDIGQFKTLPDLARALERGGDVELSHRQQVRQRQTDRRNVNIKEDADKVYEDSEWVIYVPKTYAASCKLGQGTEWCTASTESDNYYNSYSKEGKLYIIINKRDQKEKYQFHFETESFMDRYDNEIEDFSFLSEGAKKFFKDLDGSDESGLIIKDRVVTKFSRFETVTEITIPNSVTSIGEDAFEFCESLKSINIPDSVTSIGRGAFWGCNSLESINIPDSVTSISNGVFSECRSLKSITIPNSITSIGNIAFASCKSLKSIIIPDSVTSIGGGAFHECKSLESITIPKSVTSISACAFYKCTSLESINIPDGVTSIGNWAFYDCRFLKSITIPDSVTSIDNLAFDDCPRTVIKCHKGSYADTYAQRHDIPVEYI